MRRYRQIKNPGLRALCDARKIEVADVAAFCRCDVRSIHLYTTGKKPMPLIERNMAALFKLTVPDLRAKLFPRKLPSMSKQTRSVKQYNRNHALDVDQRPDDTRDFQSGRGTRSVHKRPHIPAHEGEATNDE